MASGRAKARGAAIAVAIGAAASLVACHAMPVLVPAAFEVEALPSALYAPAIADWTYDRVGGRALRAKREARYATLAFPTATTNWTNGGANGLPLTGFGAAGTDLAMSGPAASFADVSGSALYGKVFFLTKAGKFVKVDRATPTTYSPWSGGPTTKTFSRTSVTFSPRGSRAYLLADDGTLYIVNTLTMTTAAVVNVGGGGYGIAPFIDPYASKHDDQGERVYVASNNGAVYAYSVQGDPDGSVQLVSPATTYNLATGITPLYGGTRKIAAPPVVLAGVIYVGDQAGNFYAYDTTTPANSVTYGLGAPVDAAAAIELQDGYTLTDPSGAPKTVAAGAPVYAFVNAGASCCWLNLHDRTITRSLSLYIDDNDATVKYGYLRNYGFNTGGTTEYLAAQDGGNINTESPDYALPGYAPNIWSNDYLVPAETNTRDDGTNALGGPIVSYIRFYSATSWAAGSTIASATLSLTPSADQSCRVPEVRETSANYASGTGPWVSNALTSANRPTVGTASIGVYQSGGVDASGNVSFRSNKTYVWDVSNAFSTPSGDGRYALALKHNAGGSTVLWPEGPVGGGTGKKAKKASQLEAVKFRNNALNANPAAGASNDTRPLLTLLVSSTSMPTPSIGTPPIIDAVNKKVYVYYANTLFELSFASVGAFADTGASPTTLFNLAYHGDSANNAAGVGGKKPGGAYNNRTKYVGNYSAPVTGRNMAAMYVLSRTPGTDGATPTTWTYTASKITLPLSATTNQLAASATSVTGIAGQNAPTNAAGDKEASAYLAIDPTSAGTVYFGLANGRVYQFDP